MRDLTKEEQEEINKLPKPLAYECGKCDGNRFYINYYGSFDKVQIICSVCNKILEYWYIKEST